MKLVISVLGFLVVLFGANIGVVCILNMLNLLSVGSVILLFLECSAIALFYLYQNVLKPIVNLKSALEVIDFDKDVIDFSKLDSLKLSGNIEIQFLTKKFQYLLDIITERIDRVNSETYKSEHDGLTGCYNRVHLENIKGLYESSDSVCIIFIDVNNLKKMNDIFGHEAGDALLKSAASKLSFWSTFGDVYRMGGDEFMIVLVNKEKDYISKLLKRWYPTVGQLNRDSDGFKCVLSYGVAYGRQGCNFDALQKCADERMYDMKVAIKKKFGEPMR